MPHTELTRRAAMGLMALPACWPVPGRAAPPAPPDDALDRIARQLGQHAVVRSAFTQTRQISAMRKPLVTQGSMVFARARGIVWRIEQPFQITYLLGEQKVVEIAADGARRVRDVPGLAQVSRVFQAVLGSQPAALRDYFDATPGLEGSRWTLALAPRATLAPFISRMQVSGETFVENIRIDEPSGDSTLIVFRGPQGDDQLTAAEGLLFGNEPVRR